jgi:hypothetical protein
MTIASPRRRKKPYNPALAEYQARVQSEEDAKKRDRKSRDLLRNAQVAPIDIIDPISGDPVTAFRSTRKDPIADMHARKQITDCEYETARHWERAYEGSEIGGVPAMDFTKEAVDGGSLREVLTDRQRRAMKELRQAAESLGSAGNYLILQVLGTKKTLEMVASEAHWGKPSEAQRKYVRRRFHECLGTLSVLFGYAMATRG